MKNLKKSTPFASDSDGVIYVKLTAVMPFLIACCDGLRVRVFPDDPETMFLTVTDAMGWCLKELDGASPKYAMELQTKISALSKCLAEEEAGLTLDA